MAKILSFAKNKKIVIVDLKNIFNKFCRQNQLLLENNEKYFLVNKCIILLYKTEIEFTFNSKLYSEVLFELETVLSNVINVSNVIQDLLSTIEKYILSFVKPNYVLKNVVILKKYNCLIFIEKKLWIKELQLLN